MITNPPIAFWLSQLPNLIENRDVNLNRRQLLIITLPHLQFAESVCASAVYTEKKWKIWGAFTISGFSSDFTLDKCDDSDPSRQQAVPEPWQEPWKTIEATYKQRTHHTPTRIQPEPITRFNVPRHFSLKCHNGVIGAMLRTQVFLHPWCFFQYKITMYISQLKAVHIHTAVFPLIAIRPRFNVELWQEQKTAQL